MIMRTTTRDIRMIERVDIVFIRNDNPVWTDPIPLEASTVRYVTLKVAEGVPDMTPVEELRDKPIGRDPDMIENEGSSPSTVGVIENESFNNR